MIPRITPAAQREEMDRLRRDTDGKWPSILPKLGLHDSYLTGRPSPCPICKEGRDRFRFDNKDGRGTWICNTGLGGSHKGAGDGFDLAQLANGWGFKRTKEEIQRLVGLAPKSAVRLGRSKAAAVAEMEEIIKLSRPVADVPATATWWRRRIGGVPSCPDLRGREALKCSGVRDPIPAMVAIVRAPDGSIATVHRTYLNDDGDKADVPSPRRLMDIPLPDGGAVRLAEAGDMLGIAEGIETAAAAALMFAVPCWAALNAGNLAKWYPPPGVRHVLIFADNDANECGQKAAATLQARLAALGYRVDVHIPADVGDDWNDVWRLKRGLREAA